MKMSSRLRPMIAQSESKMYDLLQSDGAMLDWIAVPDYHE
jgi:hypothetical protein